MNQNSLSGLSVNYIGYFYLVFPLHPKTFHLLFQQSTHPQLEELKSLLTCFDSSLSHNILAQIKSLCQFQSSISQFQSSIDSYMGTLNSNIEYISSFKSFVTKCVKNYLCKYITSLSNHYNSCHKSLKQNIETFNCIQSCLKSLISLVNGDGGSERYVKFVFSAISNDVNYHVKITINRIKRNLASHRLGSINFYLTMIDKFLVESNDTSKTEGQLLEIKNLVSQFSGHITNYNTRMQYDLIDPLDRLTRSESTIKLVGSVRNSRNSNGNGLYKKYEKIKPKIEYCKSSLEFEVQRLQSIWNNAKMLQKQLESLIVILNNYKKIEDKLNQFKRKLETHKKSKDINMKHLTSVSRSIETNLSKIQKISNSLKCQRYFVSITTIKQDVDNINSRIKDINNILSVVKSQLKLLRPVNFGFDNSIICEVECCIKEIVSDIHKKYCCLSSELSTVFTDGQGPLLTLEGCKLSKILECPSSTKDGDNICQGCQDCQGAQCCEGFESLKKLLTTPCQSDIVQKMESIKKVICRLIDGNPKDGCNSGSRNGQQCSNLCQTGQQAQPSSTCETTEAQTSNSCKDTNIRQLIQCTLGEISKWQTSSSSLTCESKVEVKCEDPPRNSCQITGTQQPTSCSQPTAQSVVSCKDLDKVKLCVDTMVNKCNCCKLKQMFEELLKDKKVESCVEIFKWVIVTNFRELFCLYACFDKLLLDQISCSKQKLDQMNPNLKEMISINNNMNELTEKVQSLENTMRSGISELECAIEGVPRNLIQCSLQSIVNTEVDVINSSRHNIDSIYNNIIYIMFKCVLFYLQKTD